MEVSEYNTCVHQWSDALFRFALKCTGSKDDAQDMVQGSFEVLWRKRKEVEAAKGKAFLFQVAYRHSVDLYRKRSRIGKAAVHEPAVTTPNTDLKKLLDQALLRLDEQSRALVMLKDYEGYKYDEIAKITSLSEAQVRVYLHRARKTLKEYLVSVQTLI